MSERWQRGDRVNWAGYPGPAHNGEVVQAEWESVLIRWDSGFESRIAAASPWLRRVGRA